jgi:alkylhydroperoxidase family enzyme
MNHHLASSKRAGLTEQDWKALRDPQNSHFSEKEKAALDFAEKLTRPPTSNTRDADVERLKRYFSEPEIVELVLLIGLVNLTNRFTDGLGLELEIPQQQVEGKPAETLFAAD